jgi:uncharacterized membrane protein YfhO
MLDATSQGSTSNLNSPFVWNLLNVKYILAKQDMGIPPVYSSNVTGTKVFANPAYMNRAFFVDTLQVRSGKEILNELKNGTFNPSTTAFLEKKIDLPNTSTDSNNTVKLTRFENENIEYSLAASSDKFLVISEVYFPDWHAYLDGKEIDIHKTNYFMRGVIIPKGKHKLEMKYISKTFETGTTLSLSGNILLIILLILALIFEFKGKKKVEEIEN